MRYQASSYQFPWFTHLPYFCLSGDGVKGFKDAIVETQAEPHFAKVLRLYIFHWVEVEIFKGCAAWTDQLGNLIIKVLFCHNVLKLTEGGEKKKSLKI